MWIAGIAVLTAVAVGVVWLLLPTTPTVRIKPVINPVPGGDTCYPNPVELTGVRRGEEVVFKNDLPTTTVKLSFDPGLFSVPWIDLPQQSSRPLLVRSQAEENKTYFYSVSCAPSSTGEARPRIVIRSSSD